MALSLVIVTETPQYPKGAIITDPVAVDTVRTSDYALNAVQVSGDAIPPPAAPPPPPDLSGLQAAVQSVALANASQDAVLAETTAINRQQDQTLSQQVAVINQQNSLIGGLNTTVVVQNATISAQRDALAALEARVIALEAGGPPPPPPVPPNLADDLPLAEADGVKLATNSGRVLVGDLRP